MPIPSSDVPLILGAGGGSGVSRIRAKHIAATQNRWRYRDSMESSRLHTCGAAFSSTTYPKIGVTATADPVKAPHEADACILIFEEKNERAGKTVIFDS